MTTAILAVCITLLLRLWNVEKIRTTVFARVGSLPRAIQWVAPVSIGILASAGQGYLDGLRGQVLVEKALTGGGELGIMAIGLWHAGKRGILLSSLSNMLKPPVTSNVGPAPEPPARIASILPPPKPPESPEPPMAA